MTAARFRVGISRDTMRANGEPVCGVEPLRILKDSPGVLE